MHRSTITARGFSSPCLFSWDPCLYTLSRMLSRLGLDAIGFLSMLESGDELYFPVASSPSSFPLFLNDEPMMPLWRSIQQRISIRHI